MIITTTKHTITVQADSLKNRFYNGRMELLQDELQYGYTDHFERGIKNLHADIVTIKDEGFRSLFQSGYTMVLLGDKDFDYVEQFFKRDDSTEELVVSIMNGNEILEEVHHSDLSY